MNNWQTILVAGWGVGALLLWVLSLVQLKRNNPFGLVPWWTAPWGMFVWGDGIMIGIYWLILSMFTGLSGNWAGFGLGVSVFWVIRSLGEMIYWLLQQFSPVVRNAPETLRGYRWLKNDSIWFVYQTGWQCAAAAALLGCVYFGLQFT